MNISKAKRSSFRYFMRTTKNGSNMGDTSNFDHYYTDFTYDHDMTCDMDNPEIRKPFITKSHFLILMFCNFTAREVDYDGSGSSIPIINFMLLLGSSLL